MQHLSGQFVLTQLELCQLHRLLEILFALPGSSRKENALNVIWHMTYVRDAAFFEITFLQHHAVRARMPLPMCAASNLDLLGVVQREKSLDHMNPLRLVQIFVNVVEVRPSAKGGYDKRHLTGMHSFTDDLFDFIRFCLRGQQERLRSEGVEASIRNKAFQTLIVLEID